MNAPVMVLSKFVGHQDFAFKFCCVTDTPLPNFADANTKRETGRTAQLGNIQAAKVREVQPVECTHDLN